MNRRSFLTSSVAAVMLNACGKAPAGKIRLALDWKPEPEFGGFYAANYESHGLSVDILPGGSGTPTVQMLGAGSAEFGIVSADELVVARARGNDVVAHFAVFQTCPQGIRVQPSPNMNRRSPTSFAPARSPSTEAFPTQEFSKRNSASTK